MSISFNAILSQIKSKKIIRIPLVSSEELPSRGLVMGNGTLNSISFTLPLEPDGKGSHWFEVNDTLIKEAGIKFSEPLHITIEAASEWPEPEMPEDIIEAIDLAGLTPVWNSVTTKAKWEWLRWIRSTKNPETRQKRIRVACSKLQKGDKRPCCFDASRCTVEDVSKSGVLLDS